MTATDRVETFHFCTYFDRNYVSRGLALYASLLHHCGPFVLWTLCLDDETRVTLERLNLSGVKVVPLAELESCDPELLATKASRPTLEYYYTCGPSLLRHVFRINPGIDLLTYLDADVFFFNDPAPALRELAGASVGLVSHRITDARAISLYGEFNVGWVSFRSDAEGLDALEWWRARCLESCSTDRLETCICGDQKYLDELPRRSDRVVALQHKGANLAYWNYGRFTYRRVGRTVYVDGEPLLWFHFGDFRLGWHCWLSSTFAARVLFPCRLVRRWILAPYARTLRQLERALAPSSAIARRTGVPLIMRVHFAPAVTRQPGLKGWVVQAVRWVRRVGNQVFLPVRVRGRLEPEVEIILAELGREPVMGPAPGRATRVQRDRP